MMVFFEMNLNFRPKLIINKGLLAVFFGSCLNTVDSEWLIGIPSQKLCVFVEEKTWNDGSIGLSLILEMFGNQNAEKSSVISLVFVF